MKKETLADKMARKTFESKAIQQSWQIHYQAFEPILAPAFVDDYQAKIHLTAALSHISNRNLDKGMAKLKEVQKHVQTDEDKAAYLFFMGLYCEMAGNLPQMAEMYDYANEYGHSFYWPYVKAAKFHQQYVEYDIALEWYEAAIHCFDSKQLTPQEQLILASVYTNRASCLTMMHQYDQAMQSLEAAHGFGVKVPDCEAVEAVLFAALGEKEKAESNLAQLAGSPVYEPTQKTVESILDKTNPAFFPVETDSAKIEAFWSWFGEYGPTLAELLDNQQYEEGMTPVAEKLLEAFPFMEEPPLAALGKNEKGYVIELHDMYFMAVKDAFEKLVADCPEEIGDIWQFVIVH